MKIKDILKVKGSKVWMIQASQTIHEALKILVTQKIGALVVTDRNKRIVGIISERDIMRGCYYKQGQIDTTPVSELMSRKVITASPEDEINAIMAAMTENRVRHIPVMADDELLGIVSIGDVVKSLLQDSEHQIRHLKDYIYGSSL